MTIPSTIIGEGARKRALAVVSLVVLFASGRLLAQQPGASVVSRPSPQQVGEVWRDLMIRLNGVRLAEMRGADASQLSNEYAKLHDTIVVCRSWYMEPGDGIIPGAGGIGSSGASAIGFFPRLAAGYCGWMAAERAQDPAKKARYYQWVWEALDGIVADEKGEGQGLNRVYSYLFVRELVIASRLSARALAPPDEQAELSLREPARELLRIRGIEKTRRPAEERSVLGSTLYKNIVGEEGLYKVVMAGARAKIDAEIRKSKPEFKDVPVRDEWVAEGRLKRIAGTVQTVLPLNIEVVDAVTKQPIEGAVARDVTAGFSIDMELPEAAEPKRLVLRATDPLTGETAQSGEIVLHNVLPPQVTASTARQTIADVTARGLQFTVDRARKGDRLVLTVKSAAGARELLTREVAEHGTVTVTVPDCVVAPNASSMVELQVGRGTRAYKGEIEVVSDTRPSVTARALKVTDQVAVIEIDVADYADTAKPRVTLNGFTYPAVVSPVETKPGAAGERTHYVFLLPWTSAGRALVVRGTTGRESPEVSVSWPPAASVDPADPRIARMPDYQRELAKGNLEAAEKAYSGVVVAPEHAQEARVVLNDLLDFRLAAIPNVSTRLPAKLADTETGLAANRKEVQDFQQAIAARKTRYEGLRVMARLVNRVDELDTRVSGLERDAKSATDMIAGIDRTVKAIQERKTAEADAERAKEAERSRIADLRARQIAAKVETAQVSAADGVARVKVLISGLVLDRKITEVSVFGQKIDPKTCVTESEAGKDAREARIDVICIPSPDRMGDGVLVKAGSADGGSWEARSPITLATTDAAGIRQGLSLPRVAEYEFLSRGAPLASGKPDDALISGARVRLAGLVRLASNAVRDMRSPTRQADDLKNAIQAVDRAGAYAKALGAVTGSAEEMREAEAQRDALRAALVPAIAAAIEPIKRDAGYVIPGGTQVSVRTWGQSVTLKVGPAEFAESKRAGDAVVFTLKETPVAGKTIDISAVVTDIPGDPLSSKAVTIARPKGKVGFATVVPTDDVWAYAAEDSKRNAYVIATDPRGMNEATEIRYKATDVAMMAWQVVDNTGAEVAVLARKPSEVPVDKSISIKGGVLRPGLYTYRIQLWGAAEDVGNPPDRSEEVHVRVAPRAVALIVGIDRYSSGIQSLGHAVDDARAMREFLVKTAGYAPQNVLYVHGSANDNKPRLETNGFEPEPGAPSMVDTVREGLARGGLAKSDTVGNIVRSLIGLAKSRKAVHIILMYAGHGKSEVTKTSAGSKSEYSTDQMLFADGEAKDVYDWVVSIKEGYAAKSAEPIQVVGIFDACRSQLTSKWGAKEPTGLVDPKKLVYYPLYSCTPPQISNEDRPDQPITVDGQRLSHGFFTYSLLTALRQMQAQGEVTVGSLVPRANDVLQRIMAEAKKHPEYSQEQTLLIPDANTTAPMFLKLPVIFPVGAATTSTSSPVGGLTVARTRPLSPFALR